MKTQQQYDFPVELMPITAQGGISIPNKLAVVRTDTNRPLGLVSDKYAFLPHKEVVDGFRSALKGQKFQEKIYLQKDGAQLFAEYTLPGVEAEIEKGDMVGMKLLARNSYDGTAQLHMSLGSVRLVCKNGMTMTRNFIEFSHKHIGDDLHLDVGEVKDNIDKMITRFQSTIPHMQKMSRLKLTVVDESLFDPKNVKLPAYLLKEASEEFQKAGDKTVWGKYNALTFAITHKLRKEEAPTLQNHYSGLAWEIAMKDLQLN